MGRAPLKIQKKLEFYEWLVSRQDVEFRSQIKNLIVGLSDVFSKKIQEL